MVESSAESMSRSCANSKKSSSGKAPTWPPLDWAREKTGIQFPLLIDDKREAYKAVGLRHASLLHLLRRDNMQARRRAQAAGHKQHRLGKDPLQLGGSFVLAPGNKDLFVHVSETFGDNAAPADMLKAIA